MFVVNDEGSTIGGSLLGTDFGGSTIGGSSLGNEFGGSGLDETGI